MEPALRNDYRKPTLKKLTLQQAKAVLLDQAKEFLERFRGDRPQAVCEEVPKLYQKPAIKKLTSEQARMLLIGHASLGDQGAKDLMEVFFPDETPGE